MMKTIDRQEWYAVVICSGDGLIYEVRQFLGFMIKDIHVMFDFDQCTIYRCNMWKAEFFLFFVLPTLPTQFFENWKKDKKDFFFQFYFYISLQLMTVQSWSFHFVFSAAARLIQLKIKFIQTIFQLN